MNKRVKKKSGSLTKNKVRAYFEKNNLGFAEVTKKNTYRYVIYRMFDKHFFENSKGFNFNDFMQDLRSNIHCLEQL